MNNLGPKIDPNDVWGRLNLFSRAYMYLSSSERFLTLFHLANLRRTDRKHDLIRKQHFPRPHFSK